MYQQTAEQYVHLKYTSFSLYMLFIYFFAVIKWQQNKFKYEVPFLIITMVLRFFH